MSDTPAALPHVLSGSRRYCTAGYAIPRPVLLRMLQLVGPLRSSHTALMLATKMIRPLDKRDRRTTGSQLVTDPVGATNKSP
jgi:hypothetical protein